MRKEISIREWGVRFNDGKYASSNVQTQIEARWYDWYCRNSSLANKTKSMGNIIKLIKPSSKVNLEKSYIGFKNNCPPDRPLYDDFRISDIKSNITLYVIQIEHQHNECRYAIIDKRSNISSKLFKSDSINEIIQWINKELQSKKK